MIQRTGRSRRGAALIAAGLLCGAGAVGFYLAPTARAAELSSFDLRANATGFQWFSTSAKDAALDDPGTGVPMTQVHLESGPVGYGLSTVLWPGALASNGGTLLLVVQPTTPPGVANAANYPIRAESRTGQNPPESHDNHVAGTDLTATALNDMVSADAVINKAAGIPGTFGTTTTHSLVKTSDVGGVAEAFSLVQDINIGEVIKIESVSSRADASTDGTKSGGDAVTVVNGMEIGGQPAYVDQDGLHIGERNQPVNAVANQIAQQALAGAGYKIYVSSPQKETTGAMTTVQAGSLIITHHTDKSEFGDASDETYRFGGAAATVTGEGGDVTALLGETTDLTGGDLGGTGGSVGDLGGGGGGNVPAAGGGGGGNDQAVGQLQPIASHGKAIRPGALILAILGAGLLAFGMKRLSDDVLAEQLQQTTCTLEGDT